MLQKPNSSTLRRNPRQSSRGPRIAGALLVLAATGAIATTAPADPAAAPAAATSSPPAAAKAAPHRLTLAALIRLAKRGPQVAMAVDALRAARARLDTAHRSIFPHIEATSFLAPSPKIRCDNPDCTTTSPHEATVAFGGVFAGVDVTVTQPLWTFGKASAGGAAARSGVVAQSHLADAAAGDVVFQAARAYYGLKLARETLWMLEDGKSQIDDALKQLVEHIEKGASDVTVQDRLRVETLQAEVGARLTEARDGEAQALAGIQALTGRTDVDIDEDPLAAVSFTLAKSADAYLARARAHRPELAAARAGAAAAHQLARLEKNRLWPDLALVATAKAAAAGGVDNPPSAFANDPFNTTGLGVGLALRWTIDPLAQVARIRQTRAEAAQADDLARAAVVATDLEVRQAYSAAAQAHARVEAARSGEKSARAWVASVLQAQAIGVADSKDLADAYIAYFTLRTRMLSAIYDFNLAAFRLRRALGEFQAKK